MDSPACAACSSLKSTMNRILCSTTGYKSGCSQHVFSHRAFLRGTLGDDIVSTNSQDWILTSISVVLGHSGFPLYLGVLDWHWRQYARMMRDREDRGVQVYCAVPGMLWINHAGCCSISLRGPPSTRDLDNPVPCLKCTGMIFHHERSQRHRL